MIILFNMQVFHFWLARRQDMGIGMLKNPNDD
jgi:hypothetical protein